MREGNLAGACHSSCGGEDSESPKGLGYATPAEQLPGDRVLSSPVTKLIPLHIRNVHQH